MNLFLNVGGFMKKEICVVVDMINGFINEGVLSDPSINKIVPETVRTVERFLTENKDVLSFQDTHTMSSLEFEFYPPHCLKGTSESELIPELKPYESRMIKIEKDTTNGFFAEGFQMYLKNNPDLESVTVVGCCTDICVLQFTQSLKTYTQTIGKRLEINVVENAVDTFHTPNHDKQVFHDQALNLMRKAGISII